MKAGWQAVAMALGAPVRDLGPVEVEAAGASPVRWAMSGGLATFSWIAYLLCECNGKVELGKIDIKEHVGRRSSLFLKEIRWCTLNTLCTHRMNSLNFSKDNLVKPVYSGDISPFIVFDQLRGGNVSGDWEESACHIPTLVDPSRRPAWPARLAAHLEFSHLEQGLPLLKGEHTIAVDLA
jgi:hypothetical protein